MTDHHALAEGKKRRIGAGRGSQGKLVSLEGNITKDSVSSLVYTYCRRSARRCGTYMQEVSTVWYEADRWRGR